MLEDVGERAGHIRLEIQRHRLDMAALAARGGGRELDGARGGGPRFGQGAAELEHARARRMGEREAGIGRDRAPQRLLGAGVRGQQLLHRQHVLLGRARRFSRERQVPEVLGHGGGAWIGVRAPGWPVSSSCTRS